ncbi:MAG TPA: type ISP restriction/modification enzyme, partial [Ktedonobacterales bacterium]
LASVQYRDVWGMPGDQSTWGRAERKRAALVWSAKLPAAELATLYEQLRPQEATRFTLKPGGTESAYLTWPSMPDIFPTYYPGVKTSRDADLVSIDREPLEARMRQYFDPNMTDEQVAQAAPMLMTDASRYEAKATRRELLRTSGFREDRLIRVAYRPFDDRWMYWEGTTKLLDEKRADFFKDVEFFDEVELGPDIKAPSDRVFLIANASSRRDGAHSYVADKFVSLDLMDRNALCFPLMTHLSLMGQATAVANLSVPLLSLAQREWHYASDHELARDMFWHTLATLRSPQYYEENKTYLMQDWPRIPLPATRAHLEASAALGRRVGDLLRPDVRFTAGEGVRALGQPRRVDGGQFGPEDFTVTVRYGGVGRYEPPSGDSPARLWWNDRAYWDDVPPAVWAFTLGGYPVVKKWLDYRHSEKLRRPLRVEEVRYVREMVQRIATLLALGPTLDESYAATKAATLELPGA